MNEWFKKRRIILKYNNNKIIINYNTQHTHTHTHNNNFIAITHIVLSIPHICNNNKVAFFFILVGYHGNTAIISYAINKKQLQTIPACVVAEKKRRICVCVCYCVLDTLSPQLKFNFNFNSRAINTERERRKEKEMRIHIHNKLRILCCVWWNIHNSKFTTRLYDGSFLWLFI